MSRKRLPPMRGPSALHGLTLNSYAVGSWCASPDGTGKATAVGLSLEVQWNGEQTFDLVLRLKSPAAVDTLIQQLLRHKRDVWPDSP